MAVNAKISQLPASSSLTGTELIELVQGGVNVQSTVQAMTGLVATPFAINGNPSGTIQGTSLSFNFFYAVARMTNIGTGSALAGAGNTSSTAGWNVQGAASNSGLAFNPGAATIGNTVGQCTIVTPASANSALDVFNTAFNVTGSTLALVRGSQNALPASGFTATTYFVFTTTIPQQQVFIGFGPTNGGYGGSQTPSALHNMIGLAQDTADTGLQFMINNGAGTASKTALLNGSNPVTLASLQGHLLRLYVTCDAVGNCAITLTDLEAGGLTYTISYPTATTKLPVVSIGTTSGTVNYHIHCNNGGQAVALTFGLVFAVVTAGLGSA